MIMGPLRHQGTVLEYTERECFQGEGRQCRIEWANEIFVKPLCLFHLEADTFDRFELLARQVNDEADA